jgi:DNA-binding winged helix-turn-helix (wHTH) protein
VCHGYGSFKVVISLRRTFHAGVVKQFTRAVSRVPRPFTKAERPVPGGLFTRDPTGAWARVALGSRALAVRDVLLREPGALVTKDTIITQVWPGIAVEANNLTVQISALRKALGSGPASESCIQTVTGRGFRLIAIATRHRRKVQACCHAKASEDHCRRDQR